MARPSKIDRLPDEIRDAIGELRRAGRTIDEILAHIQAMGAQDISRSRLGAHIQRWDAVSKRLNESRAAAEAIMSRMEDSGADDRMARFNIQMLHASLMELQRSEDGEPASLSPAEAAQLAKAVKDLSTAARSDQIRFGDMKKLLEEEKARAERMKAAAEEMSAVARGAGVSQETMDEINRRLGVV